MSLPAYQDLVVEQNRLQEIFGLSEAALQDVIMEGFQARTNCTSHYPKTFPGLAQWANTVRALRDKTAPLSWTCSDDNNFPLCIHPTSDVVIVVQTGDRETGTSGIPSNRAPKGANTEDAIAVNQRQYSIFDSIIPNLILPDAIDRKVMWVLLYHVAQDEIRFELSLPLKMVGGKIRSWQERIVFPAIRIGQSNIELGEDDGTEIDVPVERLKER